MTSRNHRESVASQNRHAHTARLQAERDSQRRRSQQRMFNGGANTCCFLDLLSMQSNATTVSHLHSCSAHALRCFQAWLVCVCSFYCKRSKCEQSTLLCHPTILLQLVSLSMALNVCIRHIFCVRIPSSRLGSLSRGAHLAPLKVSPDPKPTLNPP